VEALGAAAGVEQAHDQAGGGALAAAGLPDDPQGLAARHGETNSVERPDHADPPSKDDPPTDREVLDQVAHLDEGLSAAAGARRARAEIALAREGGAAAFPGADAHESAPRGARASGGSSTARSCAPRRRRSGDESRQATWWVGSSLSACSAGSMRACSGRA